MASARYTIRPWLNVTCDNFDELIRMRCIKFCIEDEEWLTGDYLPLFKYEVKNNMLRERPPFKLMDSLVHVRAHQLVYMSGGEEIRLDISNYWESLEPVPKPDPDKTIHLHFEYAVPPSQRILWMPFLMCMRTTGALTCDFFE